MIEQLIKEIAHQLDAANIPYMIIGGQAVLLYGRPRFTRDIDITLGIDTDKISTLAALCSKMGLNILAENPETFAVQTRVLPAEQKSSKIRVDFIFSFTTYESQAIGRAKDVLVDAYPVKFASCEDIIIHKLIAGRAIDEEDVKSILNKNKTKIDGKYIRRWLSDFAQLPEYHGISEKFEQLFKE